MNEVVPHKSQQVLLATAASLVPRTKTQRQHLEIESPHARHGAFAVANFIQLPVVKEGFPSSPSTKASDPFKSKSVPTNPNPPNRYGGLALAAEHLPATNSDGDWKSQGTWLLTVQRGVE